MWGTQALRTALTGSWLLTRAYNGEDASFAGTASFAADVGGSLRYRETGQLTVGGGTASEAFQNHLYKFGDDAITVEFADGPRDGQVYLILALPYAAQASGFELTGVHVCPPDRYEVRYWFGDGGKFSVETTVTGPKKAYRALAVYRRV